MPVCIWHAMFCTYCWISRNGVCGVQRWRDAEEWRWLGYRADRAQTSGFLHSGQRILDGWVDSSITCWHLRWTVSHTRIHTIWWLVLAALCVFTLLWAIRVFRSPTCWWYLTWTAHFERNLNEMIKHGKERSGQSHWLCVTKWNGLLPQSFKLMVPATARGKHAASASCLVSFWRS